MARRDGFTLIELLVVIAIIAIVAAIAIPGLLASQRASNERSASASLRTLTTAIHDFRAGDRDGNKVSDFWVGDIAGLYGICPPDTTDMIKLVDLAVAGGDHNAVDQGVTAPAPTPTTGCYTGQAYYAVRSPKAGYWFRSMRTDDNGLAYGIASTSATGLTGAYFNLSKFAYEAYPDSRAAGRNVFVVSETHTVMKRGLIHSYVITLPTASIAHLMGTTTDLTRFPSDSQLKSDYSKLD
jgi:prepilin-type N-terminal cleavage/methylation domain-containing protein